MAFLYFLSHYNLHEKVVVTTVTTYHGGAFEK